MKESFSLNSFFNISYIYSREQEHTRVSIFKQKEFQTISHVSFYRDDETIAPENNNEIIARIPAVRLHHLP